MDGVTVQSKDARAGSACPVGPGEEEIKWLGDTILAGEHSLNVPHEDGVEEGVQDHDDHAAPQGEAVSIKRTDPDVVPLCPHTCFLIVGEIGASKAKRDVGDDALKMEKISTTMYLDY